MHRIGINGARRSALDQSQHPRHPFNRCGNVHTGPQGLPLVGHAALRAPDCLRRLKAWGDKYGGAFVLSRGLLTRPLVVLSDPPAVHALLQLDEAAAVKTRSHYRTLDEVGG